MYTNRVNSNDEDDLNHKSPAKFVYGNQNSSHVSCNNNNLPSTSFSNMPIVSNIDIFEFNDNNLPSTSISDLPIICNQDITEFNDNEQFDTLFDINLHKRKEGGNNVIFFETSKSEKQKNSKIEKNACDFCHKRQINENIYYQRYRQYENLYNSKRNQVVKLRKELGKVKFKVNQLTFKYI